ncbi:Fur family transcriptional regulator [Roseibium sp. MMSF_3544]|uniref:Fur family transcriptional regulator n=1 Tax=unclassified Roseibium TaxID=2629323 RepID=UPI00273D159F|nr:Fur family transcriptional regulator [Roseibium sp. MMSF_3544]
MNTRGEMWQAEILRVLNRHHTPISAYDVLETLRETHEKISPPTIYRALSALTKRGRVHRVESLNAFIACQCGQHQHTSILSICEDCGAVEESVAPKILKDLSSVIGKSGFSPMRHVIEVHGTCASCGSRKAQS